MPVGRLKKPSPPFRLPMARWYLPPWIEDKDLSRLRIGNVNVVLVIDGDALRRQHRVASLLFALDELVLLLSEIEDVDALGARIGHNDPPVRVGHHAVGANQEVEVGRADNEVEDFGEETLIGLYVAIGAEATLEAQFSSALKQQFGDLNVRRLGIVLARCPRLVAAAAVPE